MPRTKSYLTPAEYAVLGLVRNKPAYGYELQRHLTGNRGLGRVCSVEPAMVYAILKSLSGLELIDAILERGELRDYYLAHSARAELCRRLGRSNEAKKSYRRALELTIQEPERRFLERRLDELGR